MLLQHFQDADSITLISIVQFIVMLRRLCGHQSYMILSTEGTKAALAPSQQLGHVKSGV
jgi:hypothetical protein